MKSLFISALLLTSFSAKAWVCDVDGELKNVSASRMKKVSSRQFEKNYNKQYQELETSVQALAKQLNLPAEKNGKAYELYTSSRSGQRLVESLSRLKKNFSYDAASAYLFDSKKLNPKPVHYTQMIEKDGETYYLDGDRIVARLIEVQNGSYSLKVYTPQCAVREVVELSSMDSQSENLLQFKINPEFCKTISNDDPSLMNEETQAQKGVYFNMPSDAHEALQMKSRLAMACESTQTIANHAKLSPAKSTRTQAHHSKSKGAR